MDPDVIHELKKDRAFSEREYRKKKMTILEAE